MKKFLLSLLICSIIFSASAQNEKRHFTLPANLTAKDYLPNKIIFKLKESASTQNKTLSVQGLVTLKSSSISKIEQKFPGGSSKNKATVLKKVDTYGLNRVYELTLKDSSDIEKAINELLLNDAVEYAEPTYVYHTSYVPNDTGYGTVQSYLEQVGAPQAWNLIRNTPSVILAIVDSGSELTHPDLAANIYYNTAEINGNNIDDDGDGYIDNYKGWDFVGASGSNMIEDGDPTVTVSSGDHGIHVSGIASSVTDNNLGVASIAFNTAKLMIIKAASDDNGNDILRGYEGIKYAVDHGAKIVNCSWGGVNSSFYGQDIINYAISRECLIVAAAGNSGNNIPQYPAAYDGVLAVANVQTDDIKASSSNFGYYISIAAPGSAIYSTTFNNTYNYKSGTSMASPVVASAAALVKSYFPRLSMQQVGEQLRVTTDNIDAKNPAYVNRIGKGRLNVLRALTESSPSIKKQKITLVDKGQGTIPAGDTLTIFVDLKNFLFQVSNLQVVLSSNDEDVQVTDSIQTIASMASLETKTNVGPFKVYIKPSVIDNQPVEFRLRYKANGTYNDFEGFVVIVSRDYLNMTTNSIATTVTSTGRIGFLDPGQENGTLGFQFKGNQLLYEAALMIGNAEDRVSDNARATEDLTHDHFIKQVRVKGNLVADTLQAVAEFDDSGSPNPLNLRVKQRSYVIFDNVNDKSLITEYEVFNTTSTEIRNVYIGLFTDWDIDGGATNATEYDATNRLAYVYDKKDTSLPYAGMKLLSELNPAYYPLSNRLSGNILANDEFTTAEKYQTLSSGIALPGLGTSQVNGLDVSFVSGFGPYIIKPNSSVKAAFALVGGENLPVLKSNAQSVAVIYEKLKTFTPEQEITEEELTCYPNPVNAETGDSRVAFSLKEEKNISLELFNLQGQLVKTFIKDKIYPKGYYDSVYDLKDLANGVYIYRLKANNKFKTQKISVVR